MHSRIFLAGSLAYTPLDASSTPEAVTTKNVSSFARCPLWAKLHAVENHCSKYRKYFRLLNKTYLL